MRCKIRWLTHYVKKWGRSININVNAHQGDLFSGKRGGWRKREREIG
jgi:hypothetical protein